MLATISSSGLLEEQLPVATWLVLQEDPKCRTKQPPFKLQCLEPRTEVDRCPETCARKDEGWYDARIPLSEQSDDGPWPQQLMLLQSTCARRAFLLALVMGTG